MLARGVAPSPSRSSVALFDEVKRNAVASVVNVARLVAMMVLIGPTLDFTTPT